MSATVQPEVNGGKGTAGTMRAAVFERPGVITLQERPIPVCGPNDAIVRVAMTTICGTDVHILRGEYPVAPGRIIGHEPVGVIDQLGSAVEGYSVGDRVLVGAITPCGSCFFCQNHVGAQCAGHSDEWEMIGGWRLGNSADGVQADYFRVPYAQANLAKIPDDMSDEQCVLLADIASTGISAAESAEVRISQTVAVFAQGPIGLCATAGARLKGASLIIGIDTNEQRLAMSRRFGANVTLNASDGDLVAQIKKFTDGRGVDVAIEALGRQETFENALRAIRPGGTLSSLGVYSGKLVAPYEALYAGLGDQKIVTTLCPGGKERMRRLMAMIENRRVDLSPLVTHRFSLDDIHDAFDLFSSQGDGVL